MLFFLLFHGQVVFIDVLFVLFFRFFSVFINIYWWKIISSEKILTFLRFFHFFFLKINNYWYRLYKTSKMGINKKISEEKSFDSSGGRMKKKSWMAGGNFRDRWNEPWFFKTYFFERIITESLKSQKKKLKSNFYR